MEQSRVDNPQEIATDQERRQLFLRYINRGWLAFGLVTLAAIPILPEQRSAFIYLAAIILPSHLLVHYLNTTGKTRGAGTIFTLAVNFGFLGLFLIQARKLGWEEAFRTQSTIWLLMGLAVVFAAAFIDKWAAPALAFINTVLIVATRLALAPQSDPRPSAVVFWWLLALTIWVYERTLERTLARSQAELKERIRAEETMRLMLNTMSEGIALNEIVYDEHGEMVDYRILEVNQAFYQTTNYTEAETIGNLATRLYGMTPETIREFWKNHKGSQQVQRIEMMRPRGGKYFYVSTSPFVGDRFVTSFFDITAHKQVEEKLRESEEHYRALFEYLPIPAFTKNREGVYTSSNAENQKYWAASPLGKSDAELLDDPNEVAALRTADVHVMEGGDSLIVEETLQTPLGTRQALTRKAPLRDGNGNIVGILGASVDITDRKQAELELKRRAEETDALLQTSLALTSLNLDDILTTIGQAAKSLFAADGCRIFLMEPDGETLRCVLAVQERPEAFSDLRVKVGDGVTGAVAASGRAEIVNGMQNDPRAIQVPGTPEEEEAIMFAPLKERERVVGVLSIRRIGLARPFQPADLTLLQAFASMAASAVSNARLFDEAQHRLRELETLQDVSSALRHAQTPEEMLPIFIKHACQTVDGKIGSIYLWDEASGEWVAQGWIDSDGSWVKKSKNLRHRTGEGITGFVGASRQVYITRDWRSDPTIMIQPGEEGLLAELTSGVSLPLHTEERVIGVIHIWRAGVHTFSDAEQRLLSAIADMAGNALQRARLHQQTAQQIQRLAALHAIDMAIGSSLDLRLTLDLLLEHITAQPGVDAADVLLFSPSLSTLDFAAGRGFRRKNVHRPSLKLGEGLASRAVLERRPFSAPNLSTIQSPFVGADIFAGEEFVSYYAVPLLAKGLVKGVLEVYRRSAHQPDPDWLEFMEIISGQAAIAIDNAELYENLQRSNAELRLAYDTTIEGWSHALDLRDKETEGHTLRVTEMVLRLARAAGMTEEELSHVRRGALLHDIGKMGVPDHILFKADTLTNEERDIMKLHPIAAFEMLSPIRYLRAAALDIPYCHHERWDGTGYPRGLQGEQIPLSARLFAVVDVWDALRSDRPYRAGWSVEQTRAYIQAQSGKHFDPRVVDMFMNLIVND